MAFGVRAVVDAFEVGAGVAVLHGWSISSPSSAVCGFRIHFPAYWADTVSLDEIELAGPWQVSEASDGLSLRPFARPGSHLAQVST